MVVPKKTYTIKSVYFNIKYNFICLSETFKDSSALDNLVDIQGYNLVHTDHSDNTKIGEVCIYYKESLPFWVINWASIKKGDSICNLSLSKWK